MRRTIYILFILYICSSSYCISQEKKITLNIIGKLPSSTKTIDSIGYQKTFKELIPLFKTIDSLKGKLSQLGYIDITETRKKTNDSSYESTINLGRHYKYIRVHVGKEITIKTYLKQAELTVRNDSILIETAFAKAVLENLTTIASNSGNPFTSFQITSISKNKTGTLSGNLIIEKDLNRYADRIIINGYKNAPKGYLKYYARIKEGKIFNQKELLEQNERLNNLSFITSKKDPQVLFTKDSTTVYFYLERKINNRFDGFLGFATNEETNRLQLDGYVDLILTNNLNYGETLLLNYKSDGDDQTQLNVKVTLPYLFKSPLGIETQLSLFRKDSTFSENSQEVSLFYQINPNSTVSLGYKSKQSEDLIDTTDTFNEIIEDYTQQRVLGSFSFSKLQSDFFFPVKTQLTIRGEIGNRTSTTEEEEQLNINANTSHIFQLNDVNQIYIRNRTQALFSDSYLTNELYRFGGITSIRGFEENSIFANLVSTLNTEYRYVLNSSIYVHSIIDLAYFENEIADQKEKLISFGLGAGLRTKAGIFKINIANGKSENQTFRFSNTKLHFQLAIRF
ncbi:BamA/TamA family outer membrane protein [uncultured Dokdonia sp.]|uniref:BamA/TamA family outer membrane protein n=1 Tax=uncultured Dokdonia sp. TaxID=575653 RepID=UPI002633702B|nr:BamA/TamA family outer membrane protein [uncultured Dokdonia sp.]